MKESFYRKSPPSKVGTAKPILRNWVEKPGYLVKPGRRKVPTYFLFPRLSSMKGKLPYLLRRNGPPSKSQQAGKDRRRQVHHSHKPRRFPKSKDRNQIHAEYYRPHASPRQVQRVKRSRTRSFAFRI